MSLATFKKKSVTLYGTNISGKPVYSYFIPTGPFGRPTSVSSVMLYQTTQHKAVSGFSLNGVHRSSPFFTASIGTPYKGQYAKGSGGTNGRYYNEPILNMNLFKATNGGNQNEYNKNSTVSTYGLLRKKYRYLYSGQYPNYWVQPNYGTSNLSDNTSQGVYVNKLSATYSRYVDTNAEAKFIDYKKNCSITDQNECNTKLLNTSNTLHYTKFLHVPQTSGQYTTRIQRKCVNPLNYQKPYPGPTNGNTCSTTIEINPNIDNIYDVDNIDYIKNKEIEVFLDKSCN
jgi:hypothetical protein